MKKNINSFTIEEAKAVLAEVHDNSVKVMDLADYCLSAIQGCNEYNAKRGKGKDISEVEEEISQIKEDALSTYKLFAEAFEEAELADGKLGKVVSAPKSDMATDSMKSALGRAEDQYVLAISLTAMKKTMEAKVEALSEKIKAVDALSVDCINPYYGETLAHQVSGVVDLANENLQVAKTSRKEEKGEE